MDDSPAVQRVAVALFAGFTVLDAYGPVQAFASCRLQTVDGGFRRLSEICSMANVQG